MSQKWDEQRFGKPNPYWGTWLFLHSRTAPRFFGALINDTLVQMPRGAFQETLKPSPSLAEAIFGPRRA